LSGAQPAVQVFDPSSGRPVVPPIGVGGSSAGEYVDSLVFSPDGRYLGAGLATGAVVLRVPAPGQQFTALPVFQHVPPGDTSQLVGGGFGVSVAFTDDSSFLVTSGDLTVEAWDLASHLQLFHAYPVARGAMSSESDQLAVAGGGGLGVYDCGVCGGESQLLSIAKRESTAPLTPSQRANYLNQS
jgi:WD40 repeat protein